MAIFALADCNNFYAACERAFNPKLEEQPIVVLSNNDGCVIARSNEAKQLGIPMGAPFHQWRAYCLQHAIHVFSSNYALYGDMSQRVMTLLQEFSPELEIYSIDEAFLRLDGFTHRDLTLYAEQIRHTIKNCTSIFISLGIGPTKTLAKMANYVAKKHTQNGVFDLTETIAQDATLATFPVENIWGIGKRLSLRLKNMNIHTAQDLKVADPNHIRKLFSVVVEKIVYELRGVSCLPLELIQPKQQIISSRSFGKPIFKLNEIEEALSHFTARACIKLRKQKSVAMGVHVFLHTNLFTQKEPYFGSHASYFPQPTDDTGKIITTAKQLLKKIFKPGLAYQKVGVMLLDLTSNQIHQHDFFEAPTKQHAQSLMGTIDLINATLGKGTVFFCAEGIERAWRLRQNYKSNSYTTQWDELMLAHCE